MMHTPIQPQRLSLPGRLWHTLRSWVDSSNRAGSPASVAGHRIDWGRAIPFLLMHLACLGVIWVGISWTAVMVALILYLARMFAITGFYHRYFSHRSFKTSRAGQLLFGILGATAAQRGPIWWAAHHRHHHAFSDKPSDVHSPARQGFWWSHMGWFMSVRHFRPDLNRVKDLMKFPELRFLDRFDTLVPTLFALGLFGAGELLEYLTPELDTDGWQLLVWGFCISTVMTWHGTYTINSLCHVFGSRRYRTNDHSRNNLWLALLTLGEGWHNNHHHYPSSVRQGFYWWEVDITYYALKLLSFTGLIWDLKPVPASARDSARQL